MSLKRSVWRSLLFSHFLLFVVVVCGQDLQVDAPKSVFAGRPFKVNFTLTGNKIGEFKPPVWGKISVLEGPWQTSSRQMEWINGQTKVYVSTTLTYVCRIGETGSFVIPSASATIDGKEVKSNALPIEVVDGGNSEGNEPRSNASGRDGNRSGDSDVFVTLDLSSNEVYQGQAVVATMKLYTRISLANIEDIHYPDLKGFWAKEIETPREISFRDEVRNGKEYRAGILRQYVLYPQKSGELEIEPLKAVVQCRAPNTRQSFWDEFMGMYQVENRSLSSLPRKLKVLPLPTGAPSSFAGAVGKFDVKTKVDNTKVKTNEAVTYTITVAGTGNLQLLSKPELQFPTTVEVFPPRVVENYGLKQGNQTGTVAYEYVLIPRAPGKIMLPAFEFSFFDPSSRSYKTSMGEGYELEIEADSTQVVSRVSGAVSKEEVEYLGQDIRHIYLGPLVFVPMEERIVGTLYWWAGLFLIVVLFLILWIFLRRRQAYVANITLVRGRRAGRVARKRLQNANRYKNLDAKQFYEALERAIWGYFSDKLSIDLVDLSSDGIRLALVEQHVPDETITRIQHLIASCEYARYAPQTSSASQDELYSTALVAFEELEHWLKVRAMNKK
ncbi:MAG: BatD family protein [Bacteroides sp.]